MTLGERIAALRNDRGLSQAELAEKLNVSRQSISKWERDASVPELDKLVVLSDAFGVSIDELVKGVRQTVQETETEQRPVQHIVAQKTMGTQRIIGFILLALGLLGCILALPLGSVMLVAGGYFLLCSLICLLIKKHAGLTIGWITFVPLLFLAPYYVGIQPWAVFLPKSYGSAGLTLNGILSVVPWLILLMLLLTTIRAFRKKR